MSNLAAAGGKLLIDNGRERRTDGLLKHLGQIDTSSLRVGGLGGHPSFTGAGVETIFQTPGGGTIQCFDRDAQAYRDLNITARNLTLATAGGILSLPNGSITTPMLAANAAFALIAQWAQASSYTSSAAPWVESDIRVQGTFSGALVHIEWSVMVYNNTAGALTYIGIGVDGVINWHVGQFHAAAANYYQTIAGSIYHTTLAAGVHRVSVFHGVSGGTMGFHSGATSVLAVTEQKR